MKTLHIISIFLLLIGYVNVVAGAITPDNSALVLIDIWEEDFLDDMVADQINPFVKALSDAGVLLIYAPSQREEHRNLVQVADYKVFGYDTIDYVFEEHGIENIFFLGFDMLLCVLDKPMGVLNVKSRQSDYRLYLIRDMCMSRIEANKRLAENIAQNQGIEIVDSDFLYKRFHIKSEAADYHHVYPDLLDKTIRHNQLYGTNPVVLIFKNSGDDIHHLRKKLTNNDIPVFTFIESEIAPSNTKINIPQHAFIEYLYENQVSDIVYAGRHLTSEQLYNESGVGIINLYIKNRYHNVDIPKLHLLDEFFLLDDEISDMKAETVKAVVVNHYRDVGLINMNTLINRKTPLLNIPRLKDIVRRNIRGVVISSVLLNALLGLSVFVLAGILAMRYLRYKAFTSY